MSGRSRQDKEGVVDYAHTATVHAEPRPLQLVCKMPMRRMSIGYGMEIMRMAIYVFFPVGVFYYFNLPEYYDKFVENQRKKLHPQGNHPPLTMEENEEMMLKIKQERKRLKQLAAGSSDQSDHSK